MLSKLGRLGVFLGAFLLLMYFVFPKAVQYYAAYVHGVEVGGVTLSFDHVKLKRIYGASGSVRVDSVGVYFSPSSLFKGQVHKVLVQGLNLTIPAGTSNLNEIPRLDKILKKIPVSIQKLEATDITFTMPMGEYLTQAIQVKGQITGAILTEKTTQLSLSAKVETNEGIVGGELRGTYEDGHLSIEISLDQLRLKKLPIPLTLQAQIQQTPELVCGFKGSLSSPKQNSWLTVEGKLDRLDEGQVTYVMSDWALDSAQLPLAYFGRKDLDKIEFYKFKINAKGGLSWGKNIFSPYGLIEVSHGDLTYQGITLHGLKVSLPIEQMWPQIALTQEIHVARVSSPVMDLEDLFVGIQIKEHKITLNKAQAKVWGGKVQVTDLQLLPLPADQVFHLKLDHISLQPLAKHLDLQSFKAEGDLSGDLPIHIYEDASISVHNGIIKSINGGYISYHWDTALESDNEGLKLAATALQNFTYEQATITVEKQRDKEPELVLDIKGKNPRLLEGRSFEFKINLTGKLLQALESMIQTFNADMKGLSEKSNQ